MPSSATFWGLHRGPKSVSKAQCKRHSFRRSTATASFSSAKEDPSDDAVPRFTCWELVCFENLLNKVDSVDSLAQRIVMLFRSSAVCGKLSDGRSQVQTSTVNKRSLQSKASRRQCTLTPCKFHLGNDPHTPLQSKCRSRLTVDRSHRKIPMTNCHNTQSAAAANSQSRRVPFCLAN